MDFIYGRYIRDAIKKFQDYSRRKLTEHSTVMSMQQLQAIALGPVLLGVCKDLRHQVWDDPTFMSRIITSDKN